MIESSSSVTATLTLSRDSGLTFPALPPLVSWVLRQAELEISGIDLAFRGESALFETDEGQIEIFSDRHESGRRVVTVRCDARKSGSHETARQICYQIVRRIATRQIVETILWHPTRQSLPAAEFRWGALRDLPQHFVAPKTILTTLPTGQA